MLQRIAAQVRRQAVGYIALVVALSGTAYATTKVTGRDLGAIKQRDSAIVTVQPGESRQGEISCKKGEVMLGFGVTQSGGGGIRPMRIGAFIASRRVLTADVYNDTGEARPFGVTASCLKK